MAYMKVLELFAGTRFGRLDVMWASEIEEFPIAVTKVRIGGNT